MGMLVPSFNFKFGIGVWMFAMLADCDWKCAMGLMKYAGLAESNDTCCVRRSTAVVRIRQSNVREMSEKQVRNAVGSCAWMTLAGLLT